MPQQPLPVALQLEPHAIPAIRVAYHDAIVRVAQQLRRLRRDSVVEEPWLGDETSRDVYDAYNRMVLEAPEGPYAAMVAYQAELMRIHEQLRAVEDTYRRTEGDNAALWGRA